jgi:hypothetical protein
VCEYIGELKILDHDDEVGFQRRRRRACGPGCLPLRPGRGERKRGGGGGLALVLDLCCLRRQIEDTYLLELDLVERLELGKMEEDPIGFFLADSGRYGGDRNAEVGIVG